MKTNVFLLAAALLVVSTSSFAQQGEVKTKESGTASATMGKTGSSANAASSSATMVKTNAASSAEEHASQSKNQVKNEATAEKAKAKAQTRAAVNETRETDRKNNNGQVSVQANTSVNASSADNKVSQVASLNSREEVSGNEAKSAAKELSQKGQAKLKTTSNESVKTTVMVKAEANNSIAETGIKTKAALKKAGSDVKTKASDGSGAAMMTSTGVQHAAEPRPVAVKMQSQVKTNAGIKIH